MPLPGATTTPSKPASNRVELIAKIGTIVSALMASSCCWLPVLLLAVGVSGAGIASTLEAYRPLFMVVTFSFLGMAFYFTYRPRRAANATVDCCTPSTGKRRFNLMAFNKVMLWTVTVMAVVFLFCPQFVTGLIGTGSDKITADMTCTEIKIVGMTCYG